MSRSRDRARVPVPSTGARVPVPSTGARVHRRCRRVRTVLVAVVAAVLAVVAGLRYLPSAPPLRPGATADRGSTAGVTPGAAAAMPFHSAPVSVPGEAFLSWALMDRRTGRISGSSTMDETSWTASMIKAWLGADYLRRATEDGWRPTPSVLHTVEIMIRDSDNDAASRIYHLNGGTASIDRLISMCGLTDSSPSPYGWGLTNLSARDSVRMGDCIASGTGAGPQWTDWLLGMMRQVRGESDFGIRDALPAGVAATVAVKNGYEDFSGDGLFHVNCLAIGDTWAMTVMQRYRPADGWAADLARGKRGCADVATQLLAAHAAATP